MFDKVHFQSTGIINHMNTQQYPFPAQSPYAELLRASQAMGVLKWSQSGKNQSIKIAYHPFQSSRAYFDQIGQLHEAWHRVLLKVAQDRQLLVDIFQQIAENDEYLKGVLEIVKKKQSEAIQDGICFDRIDYFNDQKGQPKLVEFNLQCVGMMSHMQRFQEAKRILEGGNQQYVPCPSIQNFASAVRQIMSVKNLNGVLLFVEARADLTNDSNFLDQCRLQIQFRRKGIKVVRTDMKNISIKISLRQNKDLYYGQEKVAIVYYRNVFKINHYKFEDFDSSKVWKAKEAIVLSNALCVPPIEFQLVNQKRIQTELAKPEVLKRYASEEEAEMLMNTRVRQWEFDNISEQALEEVIQNVQANPDRYLMKPNREGGGNNTFGPKVLQILKGKRQILRSYILMQKIKTKAVNNIIIHGKEHYSQQCEYEISRYGTLSWANGKIVRNQSDGFLIRAKPPSANEGGIMTGVGSIVTWKITQ